MSLEHPPRSQNYNFRGQLRRWAGSLENLIAALALLVAVGGLVYTAFEIRESRLTREAMIRIALIERLEEARRVDRGRKAVTGTRSDGRAEPIWRCNERDSPRARAGHIQVFETIVKLGFSLKRIQANGVNLFVSNKDADGSLQPGIALANADLDHANFSGSDLRRADLRNASLRYARLSGVCFENALLIDADLRRASFAATVLKNADLTSADLTNATGLSQSRLDSACADPTKRTPKVPAGLKWRPRKCKP